MISATTISPLNRRIIDGGAPPFSFGNALQFDGINDNVTFTNIPLSSYSNASFNFWFKINTFGADVLWGSGADNLINFPRAISTTIMRVGREVGGFFDFVVPDFSTGWHMCTITKSGTSYRLYLDAVESSSGVQTINGTVNLNRTGTTYGYFDGLYDEVSIWNTELSATDVANLYNSGNGDFATNYSPANLQAYWRMNGSGTDTTAVDEQGNYDGTLNNFPASGMWVAH